MEFIWLIFAHFVGDVALQSRFQMENKGKFWYWMLAHCIIWAAMICIALEYLGLLELWKVLFLVGGHYICDTWKSRQPKTMGHWWKIYPDQAWHLIQCAIVYFL